MTRPCAFDDAFAALLVASKGDFVHANGEGGVDIAQHGCAVIEPGTPPPPWPSDLVADDAVIETYVVDASGLVTPTSDNEPFVSSWMPNAKWFAETVLDALERHGLGLAGDGYLTASLTPTSKLEGLAHFDDDSFAPAQSVGIVAIVGQLDGPSVASESYRLGDLRPMSQLTFEDAVLDDFDERPQRMQAGADEVIIFPQFGQLHAGPAAPAVAHLASQRHLMVFRATATRI